MIWECGQRRFDLTKGPLVMGILNATPDSFSDGYPQFQGACEQAARLVEEGADILDVGGESTRPGSDPVSLDCELERVIPIIEHVTRHHGLPVSVDTRRPEVARRAVAAGACIINHVSASLDYRDMVPVLAESKVGYVAMHMKAAPKTMQEKPVYHQVVADVGAALKTVGDALGNAGVAADRVLYDPGVGFGKTLEHNLELLRRLPELSQILGRPLLMGLSRKSWLTHLLDEPLPSMTERDAYTAVATALLPLAVTPVHRVHNVALVRRALKVAAALRG